MIRTIIMVMFLFSCKFCISQENNVLENDEISLIVSGDGTNKEKATMSALRSAIEQTFGTFVSSNTKILNDDMVKDEIITISSGNIKNYEYLSECNTGQKYLVTLRTTVSISKLVDFSKSKGGEVELSGGATVVMNQKIRSENMKNTRKAIDNIIIQMIEAFPSCFDYEVNINHEPKAYFDNLYGWPIDLLIKTNQNMVFINNSMSTILDLFSKLGYAEEPYEREISCLKWYLREKAIHKLMSNLRIEDDFGTYSFRESAYAWGECPDLDITKGRSSFNPSIRDYRRWASAQETLFQEHQWDYIQDKMKTCVFAGNKFMRLATFDVCYFHYSDPLDYYFCTYGMFSTKWINVNKQFGKDYYIYEKPKYVGCKPRIHIWYSHNNRFMTTNYGANGDARESPSSLKQIKQNGVLVRNESQGCMIEDPRLFLFSEESSTPIGKAIIELPITMLYSDKEMQSVKNIRVYSSVN